jgi:DNA-binding response OmpR family regulator
MEYAILVVEDNSEISDVVIKYLEKEGYRYTVAANGLSALKKFHEEEYQMVLLDLMLPDLEGFEILKIIREESEVPVLIVSAKELEADRLKGFDLGADDYIIKPFSPRELMKRIKTVLKRVYTQAENKELTYKNLYLREKDQKVTLEGKILDLTTTEYKLLKEFMSHRGQLLSRDQLIHLSFGTNYEAYDRNIDTYVKKLRAKIETDPRNPRFIHTKYGAGYFFGEE